MTYMAANTNQKGDAMATYDSTDLISFYLAWTPDTTDGPLQRIAMACNREMAQMGHTVAHANGNATVWHVGNEEVTVSLFPAEITRRPLR